MRDRMLNWLVGILLLLVVLTTTVTYDGKVVFDGNEMLNRIIKFVDSNNFNINL